MKIALYGLPCAGKTTLLRTVELPVVHGSTELKKYAENFSSLSKAEKSEIRKKHAKRLMERMDDFIADGHYSFDGDIVFTDMDGELYDVFIYLYCDPNVLAARIKDSEKNARFAVFSTQRIRQWQDFELEALRRECHKRDKDFYVVNDVTPLEFSEFIRFLLRGFGVYSSAEYIAEQIRKVYPTPCDIVLCDGDKTVITEDSFRICSDNYKTKVFDGNFYTGFQSWRFRKDVDRTEYHVEKAEKATLNRKIFDRIVDTNYVILSSGVAEIWQRLETKFKFKCVIADVLVCADIKYFVTKILRASGYTVTAYGDAKVDYYMLREADKGFLYIGGHVSRSLADADIKGIELVYDKSPVILSELREDLLDDIAICKSSSCVNGAPLARAHMRLGETLGAYIACIFPEKSVAVLTLDRGGRFFGDGVYMGLGGKFYSYNSKKEKCPDVDAAVVLIVDSVIHTGRSVLECARAIRAQHPQAEICIVTNVIQRNAIDVLSAYKIFAVRISDNSFVGKRQAVQKGNVGPDTADRLFNYI